VVVDSNENSMPSGSKSAQLVERMSAELQVQPRYLLTVDAGWSTIRR
jgi:hypothetical protein